MCHEIGERSPKMAFAERDYAIEAFLPDRAYESLRMCIAVGRLERCPNHVDACRREETLDGGTPFPIAIADQQAITAEHLCLPKTPYGLHRLRL
jgi:hypothetical protein